MIRLEKIDPNLLRQIKDQTIKEIVHTKSEVGIKREGELAYKNPMLSPTKIKRKTKRFNGLLKKHQINIFLDVEENEENQLLLKVFERETGELLEIFIGYEIEEMLMKLEDFIGFFIDEYR